MFVLDTRARLVLLACAATAMVGFGLLYAMASVEKDEAHDDLEEEAEASSKPSAEATSSSKAKAPDGPTSSAAPSASSKGKAALTEAEKETKAEFNAAKQKAFELFKSDPPEYEAAAEWFTTAIDLATAHESLASQRVALFNNRSACRERVGALEASLDDCAAVLALNKTHAKVRRRRARIFEKLQQHEAALIEICADLLIQREDFKKALREGKQPEPPQPVENVEAVMRAVGKKAADDIIADREAKGVDFGMPSSNTVTQLLMTYANYDERRERAASKEADDDALAVELAASADDFTDKLAVRLRRATKWTYLKRYEDARAEVLVALNEYTREQDDNNKPPSQGEEKEEAQAPEEDDTRGGEGKKNDTTDDANSDDTAAAAAPAPAAAASSSSKLSKEKNGLSSRRASLAADLWRQVGLYRHLAHDLDGAREAYESSLRYETSSSLRAETRVKAAGVCVDGGDPGAAETQLDEALAEDPGSSDVFMHRAQLRVIKRDLSQAQKDLEKCIERAPTHVLARLRLATVLIHNQVPSSDVEAQIEAARELAPDVSEVYQVKGEILLARNDLQAAVAEFDKAIALDASNPVPLYNKGMALIQLNSYDAPRTKELFEAALKVDPTCMVALMRLSELKLQLAATFDQAQEVVDMLQAATARCRDKDELVELATVKAMAVAQLHAAKDVGLTSFQS
mmetsp:Transcript_13871/g.45253  ORF Transcript_13871/g.45253 Transcript_13871/m.45253 type:complete len:689 (-) Transcript_13871:570-2636(-)